MAAVFLGTFGGAIPLSNQADVGPIPGPLAPVILVPQDSNVTAPAGAPSAVVTAFQDEYFHNTGGTRSHAIAVPVSPTGHWDRIYLSYRQYPSTNVSQQDPWDRLCSASIAGVEVLHCTTPRTDMTIFHDITNYASLLPQGANVTVSINTASYDQSQYYVGGQYVTTQLQFFANGSSPDPRLHLYDSIVPAFDYITLNADGSIHATNVSLPRFMDRVTAEVQLSGHGNEEDWFLNDAPPPMFNLTVDGHVVGVVQPMPYVYAPAGFYGGDYTYHPLVYWTAQHKTNDIGVYTGSGYIPPYRADLPPGVVAHLGGTHQVALVGSNGGSYWVASLSFLVDKGTHHHP
ncbi:MAG: peptide-N4-asparagine amidase [Thermoplasmatota archaeon]